MSYYLQYCLNWMVAIFKMKELHPLVLLGQPRRGAKAGENGGEKDQKAQPPHTFQVRFLSGILTFTCIFPLALNMCPVLIPSKDHWLSGAINPHKKELKDEGTASFERSWWIDRFILGRRQFENTSTQIFDRQGSTYLYLLPWKKAKKGKNNLI